MNIKLTPQSFDTLMSMMIKGMNVELFYGYTSSDCNPKHVTVTDGALFFTLKVKAVRYDSEKKGVFLTPAFNE